MRQRIGVLLIALTACSSGPAPDTGAPADSPPDQGVNQAPDDCQSVSSVVQQSFTEEAVITDAEVGTRVFATPSRTQPDVWFISVSVDGRAAVWAMESDPSEEDLGLTMVANDVARQNSDLGVDIPPDANLPAAQAIQSDRGGIFAAEGCVS